MMTHDDKRARELSICQLLADGKTRKEAALEIHRTRMTIDQMITDLKRRHKVNTESGLIAKLMREGVIT